MEWLTESNEFVASEVDLKNVRIVDINTEILKGGKVQPGLLHEETIDLTDDCEDEAANILPETTTKNIETTSTKAYEIFNKSALGTLRKALTAPINTTLIPSQQQTILDSISPSNNTIVLPPNSMSNNTIIGLPENVFLVPAKYFNSSNTFQIPSNNKFHFIKTPLGTSILKPVMAVPSVIAPAVTRKERVIMPKTGNKCAKKELRHPCFNPKRRRKEDWDGFTWSDPLGFYKAEVARANKCYKTAEKILNKLQVEVDALEKDVANKFTIQYYRKKYNLMDCRVVLDRNEVTDYFCKQKSFAKRKYCKQEIRKSSMWTPSFCIETEELLSKIDVTNPVYVVNHYSFGTIDYNNTIGTVLYINTNNLVTEMCLDRFPAFKSAVEKGVVKIVNERLLEICLRRFKQIDETNNIVLESNTVKQLCVCQKKVMFQVRPDDQYSLSPYIVEQPLLKVIGCQPFKY